MTEPNKAAALDAALAQIDRAFGRQPSGPPRVHMKVWMDPFTEDHVRRWIENQIDTYLADNATDADKLWESIRDDMANGEHRILEFHPFDRMYPPVTLGEQVGLFFRRLFGRFQRTETQKMDAEVKRACRRARGPR